MMVKSALPGERGRCTPFSFQFIYHHKQSCGVRSGWMGIDTITLFLLYPYTLQYSVTMHPFYAKYKKSNNTLAEVWHKKREGEVKGGRGGGAVWPRPPSTRIKYPLHHAWMGPAWASDFNFTGAETSVWELLAEGLRLPGWADGSARPGFSKTHTSKKGHVKELIFVELSWKSWTEQEISKGWKIPSIGAVMNLRSISLK
jgi:hypothetical protein